MPKNHLLMYIFWAVVMCFTFCFLLYSAYLDSENDC